MHTSVPVVERALIMPLNTRPRGPSLTGRRDTSGYRTPGPSRHRSSCSRSRSSRSRIRSRRRWAHRGRLLVRPERLLLVLAAAAAAVARPAFHDYGCCGRHHTCALWPTLRRSLPPALAGGSGVRLPGGCPMDYFMCSLPPPPPSLPPPLPHHSHVVCLKLCVWMGLGR